MANINDKFSAVLSGTTRPVATTLSAQKLVGATSCTVQSTTGWETGTAVHGIMYRTDASNVKVPGSQIDWKGVVSGTTISNFTVTAGTDDTYEVGTTVELAPTAAWGDNLVGGILTEHNQDGTHGAVTSTSLAVSGATTLTGALTVKSYDGWISDTNTWAYGSASSPEFTITVSGVDLTSKIQAGDRIKLTQTTVKYFIVTKIAFSTNTTITVYGGTDYTLTNATISNVFYSHDKSPFGFPLDPAKWTVTKTLGTERSFSTTTLTSSTDTMTLPTGAWIIGWQFLVRMEYQSTSFVQGWATLSTDASTETNPELTIAAVSTNTAAAVGRTGNLARAQSYVTVTSSKTVTVMGKVSTTTGSPIFYISGSVSSGGANKIEATCAYL